MEKTVSRVQLANERVSIVTVCRLVGVELPDIPDGKSVKTFCPFGAFYHSDRGMETAFRVYPHSNSAYCFAGCGFFSPVGLYAQANDVPNTAAAESLLELIGYKPEDLELRWSRAVSSVQPVNQSELAEALKIFCSRVCPTWEADQFQPETATLLSRCLDLLPKVRTAEDVDRWLTTTKAVMAKHLEEGLSHGTLV